MIKKQGMRDLLREEQRQLWTVSQRSPDTFIGVYSLPVSIYHLKNEFLSCYFTLYL